MSGNKTAGNKSAWRETRAVLYVLGPYLFTSYSSEPSSLFSWLLGENHMQSSGEKKKLLYFPVLDCCEISTFS